MVKEAQCIKCGVTYTHKDNEELGLCSVECRVQYAAEYEKQSNSQGLDPCRRRMFVGANPTPATNFNERAVS